MRGKILAENRWGSIMDEEQRQGQITLAESLRDDAGWEIFHFGYNGPNPPYVRVGVLVHPFELRMEPCFESFIRDKLFYRTKLSMEKHLSNYIKIKVDSLAFEEIYGRKYTSDVNFPFGEWMEINKIMFDEIILSHHKLGTISLETHVLCIASRVWLCKAS